MKKLSIITINYNNRDGLRKTIESVVAQTTRDFEYIVIDGGSTDGSVEVIKEYARYIDYWVSEPDKGIYNAMNKGVRAAHGEFCQFLNSGDYLNSTIVVEAVSSILTNEYDIITGYTLSTDDRGRLKRNDSGSPDHLVKHKLLDNSLSHPSSFIKRSLLLENPYDENFRIISDWNFFVQTIINKKAKYRHLDFDVAVFDLNGISSTQSETARNEGALIRESLIHHTLLDEMSATPPEIIALFQEIPYSFRLKKFIMLATKSIIKPYIMLTKMFNKQKINELPPPIRINRKLLKKISRNCRLLQ